MSIDVSENIRGMCERYEQNHHNRCYGENGISAIRREIGFHPSPDQRRSCWARIDELRRDNTEEFADIARAVVDELGSGDLTIHLPVCRSVGRDPYTAQLWIRRPMIDGDSGDPVSCISGTFYFREGGTFRNVQEFTTRSAYLELESITDDDESVAEQERRGLLALLNRHGILVGQEELVTVYTFGERDIRFYELRSQ